MDNLVLYVKKEDCEKHRADIKEKLSEKAVNYAVLNTKINIIMGILSFLGVAIGGVLVNLVFA